MNTNFSFLQKQYPTLCAISELSEKLFYIGPSYITVMGNEMATSQDFVNWVCSEAINPFLLQVLLHVEKNSILVFGKGTTHTTIYFSEIISLSVALPSIKEQQEIVRQVHSHFAKADAIERQYQTLNTNIDNLPQAFYIKCLKGNWWSSWRVMEMLGSC